MEDDQLTTHGGLDWRREAAVGAGALLVGLLGLPLTIATVGQSVVGPYEGGSGVLALAEELWLQAVALSPAAWILILSPYALVQLLRFVWRLWRPRPV
jgi:hypothetical protein